VENGWNRQEIKRLECDLVKELQGNKVVTVDSVTTILMSETMEAKAKTEYPFSYQLPEDLLPTSIGVTYRLNTRLVLDDDIKRNDHDEIVVLG
jgi:sporulation-control protein